MLDRGQMGLPHPSRGVTNGLITKDQGPMTKDHTAMQERAEEFRAAVRSAQALKRSL